MRRWRDAPLGNKAFVIGWNAAVLAREVRKLRRAWAAFKPADRVPFEEWAEQVDEPEIEPDPRGEADDPDRSPETMTWEAWNERCVPFSVALGAPVIEFSSGRRQVGDITAILFVFRDGQPVVVTSYAPPGVF